MKPLRRKLNNRDGVTILIALVGFMVAAMISIVIVTAAVTSAERVLNDRKVNQASLTVESAAELVEKEMETVGYSITEQENIADGYTDTDTYPYYYALNNSDTFGQKLSNLMLKAALAAQGTTGEVKLYDGTKLTISAADAAGSFTVTLENNDTVNVKYEMAENGTVTFTFTEAKYKNAVYLTMERVSDYPHSVSTDVGEWSNDGTTNRTYSLHFTEKTSAYCWQLISTNTVNAAVEATPTPAP